MNSTRKRLAPLAGNEPQIDTGTPASSSIKTSLTPVALSRQPVAVFVNATGRRGLAALAALSAKFGLPETSAWLTPRGRTLLFRAETKVRPLHRGELGAGLRLRVLKASPRLLERAAPLPAWLERLASLGVAP